MEAPLAESEHEPFKSTSFNDLLEIEDGHFWFEERNKLIGWAIRKFFPAAKTFLEIGCGTAFVLRDVVRRFPEMRCSAIEYFDEGVEAARRRLPDVPIETGDARALDDKWAGTDLVGSFDVLEHIPEDEAVLREIHRVLKPGGGLIVTVPQHPWLWSGADDFACHVRRYTRAELVRKVTEAGFNVTRVSSFMSFLVPLMLASRVTAKLRGEAYYQSHLRQSEVSPPPTLNRLLAMAATMERMLIGIRVPLPVGSSLILTASKPV